MAVKELMKAERFEIAFNRIHQKLKEVSKIKYTDQFKPLLKEAKEHHNIFRQYYDKLEQFAKLRNAMVHEKLKADYYIAEPNIEVVREIETICELLWKPPFAYQIASSPVKCFDLHTPIRTILKAVSKYEYSQFPIYEDGKFYGLITEGGIVKWLSQNVISDLISIEEICARDILKVEKLHNVRFINRRKSIFDLEDVFEAAFEENKKLEAVLITENGKQDEMPLGLITSWDLVQIDRTTISLSSQV